MLIWPPLSPYVAFCVCFYVHEAYDFSYQKEQIEWGISPTNQGMRKQYVYEQQALSSCYTSARHEILCSLTLCASALCLLHQHCEHLWIRVNVCVDMLVLISDSCAKNYPENSCRPVFSWRTGKAVYSLKRCSSAGPWRKLLSHHNFLSHFLYIRRCFFLLHFKGNNKRTPFILEWRPTQACRCDLNTQFNKCPCFLRVISWYQTQSEAKLFTHASAVAILAALRDHAA